MILYLQEDLKHEKKSLKQISTSFKKFKQMFSTNKKTHQKLSDELIKEHYLYSAKM